MKSKKQAVSESAREKLQEGQKYYFAEPPDSARAVSCFREVMRLAPDWVEGIHWLASGLEQQGKFKEAEALYRRAIALEPDDSRFHISLAGCVECLGRLKAAVGHYRDGLTLNPHYCEADARVMLANVLKKLNQLDEAVIEWEAVVKMEPMYPSYDKPIQDAKRELERLKADSLTMTEEDYIAKLRAAWPKESDASLEVIALADEAVRVHPQSSRLWIMRGNLIELGPENVPHTLDEVLRSYQRAIEIAPECVEAWEELGHYHDAVLDDEIAAKRCWSEAARLRQSV